MAWAVALIFLVLGGLLVAAGHREAQRPALARRVSAERHAIETITSLRRDVRKTYVALLERWLAPAADRDRLRSDVRARRAVLGLALRDLDQEVHLGADERQRRTELTLMVAAWSLAVEQALASPDGLERRHEIRRGLDEIDADCSEILTASIARADQDEAAGLDLERAIHRLKLIFFATLILLAICVVVLYLQRAARLRIAELGRRQQEQETQGLLLEGIVEARTRELELSNRRLHGSMAELSVARQSLEQRVQELATMQNQLVQAEKLQAVGQLAAGIAHEINTPTQYVGDNVRFIADAFAEMDKVLLVAEQVLAAARVGRLTPGLIAEVEARIAPVDLPYLRGEVPVALAQAGEGVQRVSDIVRAMKEFAHPGPRQIAPADLNRAVESTVMVCRNEWKYVADVDLDLASALPAVPCRIGEVKQVILNLIVNAAHAIADAVGDGSDRRGRIAVVTRQDGDWVEISVADSGTGIPAAARDRIFDPFFTTKAVGKGSGQGLALAHAVVSHHQGTISFETEAGVGTTFRVRLPLEGPRTGDGGAATAGDREADRGETVGAAGRSS